MTTALDGCALWSFGMKGNLSRRLQESCLYVISISLMSCPKSLCLRRTHICRRSSTRPPPNASGGLDCRRNMLDVWSGMHARLVGWVSCTSCSKF